MSLVAVTLAAVCAASASAQSAQAVKAAHDATLKAQAIVYTLRDPAGATYGTATLTTIGRTRSRIRIIFPAATIPSSVTLVRRADCPPSTLPATSASSMTLSPSGPVYDTVVAVPLTDLTSGNYALRFKQANSRQVCTQLH